MNDCLAVLDPAVRREGLQLPAHARGLVILVHADHASRKHNGHCFITDVLNANGLATLAVTLHPQEVQCLGGPAPGQVLIKHRLRAVFDWVATQEACRALPLALLGVNDAVPGCVAAVVRYRPAGLRALILIDGRPYHVSKLLARLSQPTLVVVGASDSRSLNRHRAAVRMMTAPAYLEVLNMPTRPVPAPGAHQAMAHAAMNWLDTMLVPEALPKAASRGPGARPATR